jgi:rhamnose transport system permease protein
MSGSLRVAAPTRYSREISVAVALAFLLLALAIFAPHFFTLQPLLSRLTSQMPALVAAIGMTLVIVSRQIDISIGSQFGMCAVIGGLAVRTGLPLPVALLASVGAGVVMGAINGALVAWMRLPSIVVTLATMVTWQETLRLWQQGRLLDLPPGTQWFGLEQWTGQAVSIGLALALVVVAAWVMKNLAAGRFVYAVGSDAEAARLAGIEPRRVTFGVFVLMGALTGLAAVMNMVQSPQVQPACGEGLELKVIAACVVGGVAVSGGRGRLWGVLPGLLLLANVNPALTHFHVQAYWEKAIQGAVILLAVVADRFRPRGKS